jgi:hypothetical protein
VPCTYLHALGQCLAVCHDLLLVLLELRGVGLLQGHCQGGDGVVVRPTLHTQPHTNNQGTQRWLHDGCNQSYWSSTKKTIARAGSTLGCCQWQWYPNQTLATDLQAGEHCLINGLLELPAVEDHAATRTCSVTAGG